MLRRFFVLSLFLASSLYAERLPCQVSWIGNTFPGGDLGWVPQDVEDIFVTPDGTVFTMVMWEEHRGNLAAFKDGRWQQQTAHWREGGIDREVGRSLCVTDHHVFFATDKGRSLGRRDRSNIASRKLEIKIVIGVEIVGVAASADRVFAIGSDGLVRVLDHELKPLGQWTAVSPGEACVDHMGWLWIIDTAAGAVRCYDAAGKTLPPVIAPEPGVIPADVAITPDHKLLIADAGTRRQVRVYGQLDDKPILERTWGVEGGIQSGPVQGQFGDQRFISPVGVGADAQGNVYVASGPYAKTHGGTAVIESYAPDGHLNWRVLSTEWLDTVGFDQASDGQVLFGSKHRYAWNPEAKPGEGWQVKALTLNPDRFPDDPRLESGARGGVWHRMLKGKPFLFMPDMTGGNLFVYRFNPQQEGETAIPCAILSTKQNWTDLNGNGHREPEELTARTTGDTQGWYVDDRGTVWQASKRGGIYQYELIGLNDFGVPVYRTPTASETMPAPFTELRRVFYDPASDTMYLGGATADHAAGHWKPLGPVLARYDHWTGDRKLAWQIVMPHEGSSGRHESFEPFDFAVEGDFIFVAYAGRLPSQNLPPGTVMIYAQKDGSLIGHLQPDATRAGPVPMDALQDMVHSINVHRRTTGEYLILIEDDGYTKNLMYRWKP